jgi:hypothetical protein
MACEHFLTLYVIQPADHALAVYHRLLDIKAGVCRRHPVGFDHTLTLALCPLFRGMHDRLPADEQLPAWKALAKTVVVMPDDIRAVMLSALIKRGTSLVRGNRGKEIGGAFRIPVRAVERTFPQGVGSRARP